MDDTSILDELNILNSAQKGQKKSRIDHLNEIAAIPLSIVAKSVDVQERRQSPTIVAFFQIPSPIFSGPTIFSIATKTQNLVIDIQLTPIEIHIDQGGKPKIRTDENNVSFNPNATQVCAFIPFWSKRAEYYPRYESCFTTKGMTNGIVIEGHESWIDGRPLRAVDFEHNISRRLVPDLQFATRRFVNAYCTVAKEEVIFEEWLYSYFIMPFPWRLNYNTPPTPVYKRFIDSFKREKVAEFSTRNIESGLRFSLREFSRFEKQIFSLNRMMRDGNYAITVVAGLSLIEWILKIHAVGKEKNLNLSGLIELFDSEVFSPEVRAFLHDLRRLRNTIVHLGEYAEFKGNTAHVVRHLNVDEKIGREDALKIIDIAWNLFRESNSGALQR